tara:strand:- start:1632 stop:1874 length:243 start_codon:yes stop_codon:yes gene_type:complete
MNLTKEFTRINGALTTCESGQELSQDLAKIQQRMEFLERDNSKMNDWSEFADDLIDQLEGGVQDGISELRKKQQELLNVS